MRIYDTLISKAINGGSGGGGGGGMSALIVRYISDAEHTDKTFGEIYEAWLGGRIVIYAQNINDEYQTGQYGAIEQIGVYSNEGGDYYGTVAFEGCSLTTAVVSSMEEVLDEYLIYAD